MQMSCFDKCFCILALTDLLQSCPVKHYVREFAISRLSILDLYVENVEILIHIYVYKYIFKLQCISI